MKSNQNVTRIKLKVNQINDFILLGLVSSEPDYKLSLALNKKFKISLKNILPVKFDDDKGYELTFSRFSDSRSSQEIVYNLFSNRSGKHFLLKKLKNIDYLFQVQDPDNESNISSITAKLREVEAVNAVFNIDVNILKDKNLHYIIQ